MNEQVRPSCRWLVVHNNDASRTGVESVLKLGGKVANGAIGVVSSADDEVKATVARLLPL